MSHTAVEVSAETLEREIRESAPIRIVDVREPDSAAAWPIDAGDVPVTNLPLAAMTADPRAAVTALGDGRELRVICARGRTSRTAAEFLNGAGVAAVGVRGGMAAWARVLTAHEVDVPGPVKVAQFQRQARGCLSYMVVSGGRGLVVDPAPDVTTYLTYAEHHGVRITEIVDTHVHADHLSGMRELARRTGAAAALSRGAFARGADFPGARSLRDGDRLLSADAAVRVVELPGHTSDNIGVLIGGAALIAGDSLFADSVARPDLEAGDGGAADAARVLHRTLRERVLPLGDEVVLLPCHYAGGRVDGAIAPTLGEVRRAVGLLGLDVEPFVDAVLHAMPPRPANYRQIIATNLGRASEDPELEVGANNCAATVAAPVRSADPPDGTA